MKKARNRVKDNKASNGHHFHLPANGHSKSQWSVKSDCRIQPYRTPGKLNTAKSFSTSFLCTRCGAWYVTVTKQTNKHHSSGFSSPCMYRNLKYKADNAAALLKNMTAQGKNKENSVWRKIYICCLGKIDYVNFLVQVLLRSNFEGPQEDDCQAEAGRRFQVLVVLHIFFELLCRYSISP